MATPTLDLLCCVFAKVANQTINETDIVDPSKGQKFENKFKMYLTLYHSTVIIMCVLSILGALYVLWPKRGGVGVAMRAPGPTAAETRHKWILFWLSFADIMACLGLIVLSSVSLSTLAKSGNLDTALSTSAWEWMCIMATAWIHFFFLATYMWTTCYAVDVYLYLRRAVKDIFKIYFFFSWIFPLVFLTFGLLALYRTIEPQLACSASKGNQDLLKAYYLCLFVPLVIVLMVNPIFYILSSKKVTPLMRAGGIYGDRERNIEKQVRQKFLKIVIVLVVCWFPNLINGILLLSGVPIKQQGKDGNPSLTKVYLVLWIFMAILNPLQAFLNTLVYWGPTGCSFLTTPTGAEDLDEPVRDYSPSGTPWRNAVVPSDSETAPLIRGRVRDTLN